MSAKVADRIDPFSTKASIKSKKQKRSQGSSHYRTKNAPELQALPHLKGKNAVYYLKYFMVNIGSAYLGIWIYDISWHTTGTGELF